MKNLLKTWMILVIAFGILLSGCSSSAYAANNWPGLTVNGETAYIASGNSVYSIRTSDGGMIWQFPEKSASRVSFYASPVIDGAQLVVGDYVNTLYGIDVNNGTALWTFAGSKNRYIAEVLVDAGNIYAPSADHYLYALDSKQKLLWKMETGQALWAKPVSSEGVIYQASLDHNLYALKAETGEQIWKTDLGGAAGYSPAQNGEGMLFIGTLANELIAVNKTDGTIEWRFPTSGAVWATPLLKDGILYFGDISGSLYSVDALTGNMNWSMQNTGAIVGSPVIIPDGLVYGTTAGEVTAVKFNGEKIWTRTEAGEIYSTPGVTGEKVIVAITKGDVLLKAYSLTGADLWSFSTP